jgi:3',5'-cyclic AMP phosphodiesterase CpdA
MKFVILTPALACPSLVKKGDPLRVLLLAKKKEIKKELSNITYSSWKKTKEKSIDTKDITTKVLSSQPDYHISPFVISAYKKRGLTHFVEAHININPEKGLYQLNSPYHVIDRIIYGPESPLYHADIALHHPFYIGKKDYLNIAHVSDNHAASRMYLLQKRWDSNFNNVWCASSLGNEKPGMFSNYNDQFEHVLQSINNNKAIDIIIHTGDIIDYNRGHHNPKGENDLLKDYYANKNWILFHTLLYNHYEKPFFSILGNHDYRLHPYPPNPVLISRKIREFFNMAPTVNLTRNEINTIHEDPHALSINTKNHLITRPHSVRWYSLMMNPCLDYYIFYGNMAFLMLDWNVREDHEGGTPWARNVISDKQWALVTAWYQKILKRRTTDSDRVIAVVAMHPSVFNPFPEMGDKKLQLNPETNIFYEKTLVDRYTPHDLVDGTFRMHRSDFIRLCLGNPQYGEGMYDIIFDKSIDLILNGHAHRSGLFQVEGPYVYMRTPETIKKGPIFCNAASSGPFGIQNEKGGLRRVQLSPPGYHAIIFEDTIRIQMYYSDLVDIREQTRRDYGEIGCGEQYEVQDDVTSIFQLNSVFRWHITNLKKGSTLTKIVIYTGLTSENAADVITVPLGWKFYSEKSDRYIKIVCEAHDRGQGIYYKDAGEVQVKAEKAAEKMGSLVVSWDMNNDMSSPVCVRVPAV